MHIIVTPEYITHVLAAHPNVVIYALRVDRGLSTLAALKSEPGTLGSEEKGLNSHQYIVPGASAASAAWPIC